MFLLPWSTNIPRKNTLRPPTNFINYTRELLTNGCSNLSSALSLTFFATFFSLNFFLFRVLYVFPPYQNNWGRSTREQRIEKMRDPRNSLSDFILKNWVKYYENISHKSKN